MRFVLPERLGTVSGGSWALLGAVLDRAELGAKLAPKSVPEAPKNDLEN